MSPEVYIVASGRTPIGSIGSSLSSLSSTQLGARAIKGVIVQAKVKPELISEVLMGCVLTANIGQSPARQSAIFAGLSEETDCTTINKVCASGTKAIMLGSQSIALGQAELVIAGGMESMSNVPYYLDKARNGFKLGHGQITDGIIKDGLWDVYNDYHMGNAAENTARSMNISREAQDEYAIQSYQRAQNAWKNNFFETEIFPVSIAQKGKEAILINQDEEYLKVNFDKIPTLRPVFEKEGTITAANASSLNDGAAAVLLASKDALQKYNLKPIAKIIAWADAAQAPEWFTTSPSKAISKALSIAKLSKDDIDFFEINEAFSVVSIANNQILDLNPNKVNVWGGAVSLGHPIGCSGARIVVTLLNVLQKNTAKYGIAAICNGGGGSSAMVIELIN
ncbi:MAG: acetyl-CoA C-acyltransferase [Cytophagales bacterium]|nr:MAG: acetyl-CoA C-acyltransferase [Cytophagales bacterium]